MENSFIRGQGLYFWGKFFFFFLEVTFKITIRQQNLREHHQILLLLLSEFKQIN